VALNRRCVGTWCVHKAVEGALKYGCYEAAAVRLILGQEEQSTDASVSPLSNLGELERYGRPTGDRHDQSAIWRMEEGIPRSAVV